ncbi:MAG: dependent oxidoreductase family protein [Acidimicrobiales bacterium]|nr:dependent oxidoreductase family protein [Acidimicrobiales bacterium]
MSPSRTQRVVIVGGAIVGSFCAWELRRAGHTGPITVVDKDMTYARSSTALSAASIRTQFGTPTCIAMSLHAVELFRDLGRQFGEADAQIDYVEAGYLILGTPDQITERTAAAEMQQGHGADIAVLTPDELAARFPHLDFDDVGIGTFGMSGEGWFDAWSLLSLVKRAARRLGVEYVEAPVTGFEIAGDAITSVRIGGAAPLPCDTCVLAAGALSGRLAALVGIDLPIVPKKRSVFNFQSPVPRQGFPMLFDSSGIWVRPEGDGFIGGIQPAPDDDHDADDDFEPHRDLFDDIYWPLLVQRVPEMDQLRLRRSWAGHYEVNLLDHNAVIGSHDLLGNLLFATGFSGHGVMHAPAAGRGIAELITAGRYDTIDLTPLGWDRVRDGRPMVETIVY